MTTTKPKLCIQTKAEFEKPKRWGWEQQEVNKKIALDSLYAEIKRCQERIQEARKEILQIHGQSFSEYQANHMYADWVKEIRAKHKEEYDIIENEDSLKIR